MGQDVHGRSPFLYQIGLSSALGGRSTSTDLHFLDFFSLDGKLFATLEFPDENIFEQKFPLLSSLQLI